MFEVFAPFKWEALFARWPDMLWAFGVTVAISVLALIIALVLGVIFGVLSVSRSALLRGITRVYVEVVQNIPLLLQVFVFYAIFPLVGINITSFFIGVFAIGIYHGGYISEVVRSGIGSIHHGQFEAAKSQGFSYWQSMFSIILPQAVRIIMPPLAVQAANLIKNTSVLALIAGGELMYFSNSFAGSTSYYGPVYVVAIVLYFIICFPLSRLALYLETRTRSNKHIATGNLSENLRVDVTEATPGTHDITGRAAADSLAAGIQTMQDTVNIAPAPAAPSPRHPLHTLVDPENPDASDEGYPITGIRAASIADEIGKENQQLIDEEIEERRRRTKAGRTGAKHQGHAPSRAKIAPGMSILKDECLPTETEEAADALENGSKDVPENDNGKGAM
ncbi:MAG: amino acid ABC transporter permease [Raoultibacter sp.]